MKSNRNGAVLLVTALLILLYQNCARVDMKGPAVATSQSSIGGDSYDGKLGNGTYYRAIPKFQCGADKETQGTLTVTDQSIQLRSYDANCRPQESTVAMDQAVYDYRSSQPTMVGYQDGIFVKFAKSPSVESPAERVEAFCVDESSVKNAVVVKSRGAQITAERSGDFPLSSSVTRQVVVGSLTYDSAQMRLVVDVQRPTANRFAGTLTVGGVVQKLQCRLGAGLDPVAPQNPPAIRFSILGLRGGADVVDDIYLTDFLGSSVVAIENVPAAVRYQAQIVSAANQQSLCGPVASPLDRVDLGCKLNPGASVQLRATVQTVYGMTFTAQNNGFAATVSSLGISNYRVTPAVPRVGTTAQFSADVTSSQNATGTHVHFQIYDRNWNFLSETVVSGQDFAAMVTRNVSANVVLPAVAGDYWLEVAVFNTARSQNLGSEMTVLPLTIAP